MESRLVKDDTMQRLVSLEDLNDVFLLVSDTVYKDVFPVIGRLYEADSIVMGVYNARLAELLRFSPQPDVVRMFLLEYDFRNFKSFLKTRLAGLEIPRNGGSISDDTWERVLNDLKTDLPPFWSQAMALIRAEVKEDQPELTPAVIDLVLDAESLIQQVRIARAIGYPIISKCAEAFRTVKAVEIIWRAKEGSYDMNRLRRLFIRDELDRPLLRELADLPLDSWAERMRPTLLGPIVDDVFSAPEAERVTSLTRRGENLVLDFAKAAKTVAFGPDRIYGYLCGLRTEVFNLRLVLAGKVNRISSRLLQARLRGQYV